VAGRLTKRGLYDLITEYIVGNGFNLNSVNYCIDAVALANRVCVNLKIEYLDFRNLAICGLLHKTPKTTSIALNSRRSAGGRNFDCMHELIHYWLHEGSEFICDDNFVKQDTYIEWQANEGAAQFLMPYQVFIPTYCKMERSLANTHTPNERAAEINRRLAKRYNVGGQSVEVRVKTLGYEIGQFKDGVLIGDLQILSQNHQKMLK
jgi:Zn-dependent peptidase ImmA (M78 family)